MGDNEAKRTTGRKPVVTRAEQIRRTLVNDIVSGRRSPGTALDEVELATTFGASRTPVREALRQLESEGLAQSRPRRGAVVTTYTSTELAEMFVVMAELEALCGRLAAAGMTAQESAELESVRRACEVAVRADSIEDYLGANDRFHDLIYAASHNEFLAGLTQTVRCRIAPYRRSQFYSAGRLVRSLEEHERIADGLRRRDSDGVARELRSHIFTVEHAYYLRQVAQNDDLPSSRSR